jgi:hypothetical protein
MQFSFVSLMISNNRQALKNSKREDRVSSCQGDRVGDNVLLVFASPPGAGENGRPLQSLVAFERVTLQPGEATESVFAVEARHLMLTDADATSNGAGEGRARSGARRVVGPGQWRFWLGADGEVRKTASFFEFSLCLSRACLGKMIVFI